MSYDDKQAIQAAKRKLEKSLEELTDTFTYKQIIQEREKNQQLEKQIQELKIQNNQLAHVLENAKDDIQDLQHTLKNIPQDVQQKYVKEQKQNYQKDFELEF